jgi:hypothetical protein
MHNILKMSSRLLLLLPILGSAACDHAATSIEPSSGARASATAEAPERAALDDLTRAVALAMNDAGLRHRVKADLRASRFTVEHKLLFSQYLHGESGGILLAKLAKVTGRTPGEILALVARVRPIEFYMPVQSQRESWTGGPGLYVGSLLEDHTAPTVYDLAGRRVDVAVDVAPDLPTLALVPVETDFSRPLPERGFRNGNDRGGEAIGTIMNIQPPVPCDPYTSVEPCDQTSLPQHGVYYTAASLLGVGEGGLKGNPEIEVHVIRVFDPTWTNASSEPGFTSCQAGETKTGPRYFNQDAENWTGNALVLDSAQSMIFKVDSVSLINPLRGFVVELWEDDYQPCKLITNLDMRKALNDVIVNGGDFPTMGVEGPFVPYRLQTVRLIHWDLSLAWAILGLNDEFLGIALPRAAIPGAGYSNYTHLLFRQEFTPNGAITLKVR